ncbi:FtsX-like permease family protein [Bacillus sp. ISL-37]|jgi:bacitracin transport system permease protein|uniref:FtsX-like permease family protein n=1 Tax=Bacillus sp. ISL-37 TaxID=2819123 RepID=UPI001BE8ACFB|nr:FtsX-like permease family protein [Bacillus sp. ISL-37]MBT2682855.1 bacitracin ABC transporter permease [Bacillus sp. ISL-37]
MSINQIMLRNLKKNLKNYYLYIFALIFSVALYFAFVTLQYDPAMDETKGSIKGGAAIKAASVLLVGIVTIFLLYANNIFIKRRSKEIGLFQLIGMTKSRIFRILTAENIILYYTSLALGIFLGFSVSKLILLILFKITQVDGIASLNFSVTALTQTLIVFTCIFGVIMLMNFVFIKRQSILSLFRVISSSESKAKKLSLLESITGFLGILLIIAGYYVSSQLFNGNFTTVSQLFLAMTFILVSVIIGTYLFYKGSVSTIANLIRKKKDGYLNINEVLSLSSIMFRMKTNAVLLTIITTVSALAIGLLSLSYISYYSAEQIAKNNVPANFSFVTDDAFNRFGEDLSANGIPFKETKIEVLQAVINAEAIIGLKMEEYTQDPKAMSVSVISEKSVDGFELAKDESYLTGYSDIMMKFISMKDSGPIELIGNKNTLPLRYLGMKKDYPVSRYFGGSPVVVVDDSVFKKLKGDLNPSIQKSSSLYIGVDIKDEKDLIKANTLFNEKKYNEEGMNESRLDNTNIQKRQMGLAMFIVGFLGLTFLVTSGCILYFKQMDQSEDEKPNYTILRKLGFTQGDLLRGIQAKQAFNFGIPLVIGLMHSYFAVKSGWFLFGTELWLPMFIVMVLYTLLYSTFGILSVIHSKKVIHDSL